MPRKKNPPTMDVVQVDRVSNQNTGESGFNIYLLGHLISREWNTSPSKVNALANAYRKEAYASLKRLGWVKK